MAIKHFVLGVLTAGEAHGYALGERLRRLPGMSGPLDSARLYATLVSLEREGLVTAREEPGGRGRTRRVFRLTTKGTREVERWLEAPVIATESLRRPLLVRLALAGPASETPRASWRADLGARRRALAGLGDPGQRAAASPLKRLARMRTVRQLEIEIELLERLLSTPPPPRSAAELSSRGGEAPVGSGSR